MKYGIRKPSLKKIVIGRTTNSTNRTIKKSVIPGYSCRGIGWIKNPKHAAYNYTYNKSTFSIWDLISTIFK
ncbi:hypothetical protein [Paraclostridium tenue]|uniref:Uncharacterized protein n=1 Tax=Paraclostridium tenue TaxID=1737 RepID=A0ABP3XFY2_9FIRM